MSLEDSAPPNSILTLETHFVEAEGFEPSSKQGKTKLSTSLFCVWFSS